MTGFTKLAAAALFAASMGSAAQAATFDFQAIADGAAFSTTSGPVAAGDEGSWAGVVGGGSVGILDGGISVVATGTGSNGATLNAYFDSGSAGLGVCGTLTSDGQCSPSNDDNVGSIGGTSNSSGPTYETLTLTFSTAVQMLAINLAGEGHGIFDGTVLINGMLFGPSPLPDDFADMGGDYSTLTMAALATLGASSIWTFQYVPTSQVSSTDEFYIDSVTVAAVPLPAAGLLLAGALGGLAVFRRRRTA